MTEVPFGFSRKARAKRHAREMNLPKSIRAKFAEISRICEPAGFETLVDIAISYSDLIVSCIEVSNKDRSYSIDILHEIVELGNFIRQTIVESYRMRLFEESESLREIKGSSKKANELARKLHTAYLQAQFLLLLVASSDVLLGRALLLQDESLAWAGWDFLVQQVRRFPALTN
jgi:hypothetical protein